MRKEPIIAFVRQIRKRMMKEITKTRQTCLKWPIDVLTFIARKMNSTLKVGSNYHVILASDTLYEIEIGYSLMLLMLMSIHVIVGYDILVACFVSI